MRQIVLDTETTGLEPRQGHRIIEIGCVEVIDRRITTNRYHQYINPQREVDEGAIEVHGISNEFLVDKPLFEDIVDDFLDFIRGAELVIHNAPFDVGFLDHELGRLGRESEEMEKICSVLDTLVLARKLHPGQKNNLDALCKRYSIDNSQRDLHGALLDAEILADVYLTMTGGQTSLSLGANDDVMSGGNSQSPLSSRAIDSQLAGQLSVRRASAEEILAHEARLTAINEASSGNCVWLKNNE